MLSVTVWMAVILSLNAVVDASEAGSLRNVLRTTLLMSVQVFTPKQIAIALGVSESSVKRWVDSGRLQATKTAGGHRKVPMSEVAEFVRATGHELAYPGVLGMAPSSKQSLESAVDDLFSALIEGRGAACRELVLGFYQRGESIAALGDGLIGPAFCRIGDGWAEGTVRVFEERRACELMNATLHELKRWIPPPRSGAPTALVAAPSLDFADVPIRLIELLLVSSGWRVTVAGSGLPLREICEMASEQEPRLVCLSATHLEDPDSFVTECNAVLARPLKDRRTRVAVGGGALRGPVADRLECDLFAATLDDLVAYQARLLGDEALSE